MTVQVKLFASLTRYLPPDAKRKTTTLDLSNPATVGSVLKKLNVPEDLTAVLLVNGRQAKVDTELAPGDVVSVFPPVAGGS